VNRSQRLHEVIRVCRREEVARFHAPPDWGEWAHCPDCAADTGQACYDVLGTTRTQRFTERLSPHPGRLPASAEVET
jgi:hypothetical protein